MGKELAFTTSAFISTDNLETFYAKKSDVICFWFPPRCDPDYLLLDMGQFGTSNVETRKF